MLGSNCGPMFLLCSSSQCYNLRLPAEFADVGHIIPVATRPQLGTSSFFLVPLTFVLARRPVLEPHAWPRFFIEGQEAHISCVFKPCLRALR
jgi:hypothetical protein